MSIGQFYGASFPKLRLGHVITGPFEQIGNFHPTEPVVFGTLLKYTANKKHYVAMDGTETDATLFAGVALVEKAGSPHQYPGTKTRYEIGEPGNVLVVGTVAVLLGATGDVDNIIEGGKVYVGKDGLVTTEATDGETTPANHLLIPNLVFTADVENDGTDFLVGVKKLY